MEASEARSAAAPPGTLGAIEEEESDDENEQDNTGSDDEQGGRLFCHSSHQVMGLHLLLAHLLVVSLLPYSWWQLSVH